MFIVLHEVALLHDLTFYHHSIDSIANPVAGKILRRVLLIVQSKTNHNLTIYIHIYIAESIY